MQRLLLQFGKRDNNLIELKIQNDININNNNNDMDQEISKASQKYYKNPWASNIPVAVFIALLKEAKLQYGENLPLKGNDIEMFHFLTGGPLGIDLAPKKLIENLEKIKDLILNKKFTPFPQDQ